MEKKNLVIYHGDCNDGLGAALAAWKFFGDKAEYIPGVYGLDKSFPFDEINVKGRDVFILDFSYDRASMERLEKEAAYVRLVDHHKSAYDELHDMSCCTFNMEESGAMMAWKFFHPKKPIPYMFKLIQDRDLWTNAYPEARDFMYATNMLPRTLEYWETMIDDNSPNLEKALNMGKVLTVYQDGECQAVAKKCAQKITVGGIEGHIVNCNTVFVSDLGSYLSAQTGTFAILWHENSNGLISCSLRSAKGFSSLELSQTLFGGGGHPQANASKVKSYIEFQEKLKEYEFKTIPGFGKVENEKKKSLKP